MTQTQLMHHLHYEPTTGVFRWIRPTANTNNISFGDIAGHTGTQGYTHIFFNSKMYKAHRLVFLYMTGNLPIDDIDHINHIKDDNRWVNLRDVTTLENCRNMSKSKFNTSGVNGVHFNKQTGKWVSRITVEGKRIPLGSYVDINDAADARKLAEVKYGFHVNHGT